MPRFQSRLFNWIDQSLPAKLGRSARRLLDRQFKQILNTKDLPRLLAYQVAKALLYPVYLIGSTTKRVFPALNRNKSEAKENLRSQPETSGFLPESGVIAENIENSLPQDQDFSKPEIPLLLRPLAKFLNWIDRTKLKLDRNIAAIVKRQPDHLATNNSSETESNLLANRIFAEIWQQQIEQKQANSNGLAENVALGKSRNLEQLRRLIEAAIAYFFGNSNINANVDVQKDLNNGTEFSGLGSERALDNDALPKSFKENQPRVNAADSGVLKENAALAQSTKLDRFRELIAAAIAYFIGKRSLDGDELNDIKGADTSSLTGEPIDKLQKKYQSFPARSQNVDLDNVGALKVDDQFERLQRLISDAIAYFFGRQLSKPILDETSDITVNQESQLTMEDLFGDDNGPWPLPLEYESTAFAKSPDKEIIHSSGELQNFETTTTQISQERLDGTLLFEEELLGIQNYASEGDRPLRAWIEANATILGYVYNPVMIVVFWLDAIVLKVENLIIAIWNGLSRFPIRLILFIRYGNRDQE